jgi:serine/threonine-protein kinase
LSADAQLSTPESRLIAGTYSLSRPISTGRISWVYEAFSLATGQRVAVKLPAPGSSQTHGRDRLAREAFVGRSLTSPHAVAVVDASVEGDAPFVAFELLEGQTAREYIDEHGPLSVSDALIVVLQACDAMAQAHDAGILHRDLRASHLFLSRVGQGLTTKVIGFSGTQAFRGPRQELSEMVVTAASSDQAPEQAHGRAMAASDVWSLGACLYELLTCVRPSLRDPAIERVFRLEPDRIVPLRLRRPEVPVAVAHVVKQCLATVPAHRYANATELSMALRVAIERCAAELPAHPTTLGSAFALARKERDTLQVDSRRSSWAQA